MEHARTRMHTQARDNDEDGAVDNDADYDDDDYYAGSNMALLSYRRQDCYCYYC